MYITIEGTIGVGKTTLTKLIADRIGYMSFFENVDDNPLLEKFYKNPEKWAFQNEMFFLVDRYKQFKELDNKKNKNIVSDFNYIKNLIFAKKNLTKEEFTIFEKTYEIFMEKSPSADLEILLISNLDTIKKRIAKRGRKYEENIDEDYLKYLIDRYNIYAKENKNILVIDAQKYNFADNEDDKNIIIDMIKSKLEERNESK